VTKLSSTGNSLIYSTYLGGGGVDYGQGIAVDGSGNAYVTGFTASSNFPTLNPYQSTYQSGDYDAFVTKLSNSGNSLIYSTYLGGGDDDMGFGIAVDGNGNAYVTGHTYSLNFPTLNPYQTDQGGDDAFVTKLSSTGSRLIYSTYIGGESWDWGSAIAVDGSGNAYVTGGTGSLDFPTQNPYQAALKGWTDAFVTKLSSSGNSLIYSTYLGGNGGEGGRGIAIDTNGHAYVTGGTGSSDFPTMNPYQTYQGGGDVFVTKLSSSGNSLIYSSYLGGGAEEEGYGIAVDLAGSAYLTGYTGSSDFPNVSPFDGNLNGRDAFVTKLNSAGNSLIYSTYLGGGSDDRGGYGIAAGGDGNAYVTGTTTSSDFPTLNPYQTYQGGYDAFVTKLRWVPDYICGDADGSGQVALSDVIYLVSYLFEGGAAPQPIEAGDVDCNGRVNLSDAVYLVNYVFGSGPEPCAGCK
jgi:hypothetical protein